LTDKDGEIRELTVDDFKQAVPFSALPEALQAGLTQLKKARGPQQAALKTRITIRLSQDVVNRFRATGRHWQTRMDEALKEWMKAHPPAS
jgi:uncharacterized protein (DUF4415 family)